MENLGWSGGGIHWHAPVSMIMRRAVAAALGAVLVAGVPAAAGLSAASADEVVAPATDPAAPVPPATDPAVPTPTDPPTDPPADPLADPAAAPVELGSRTLRLGDAGADVVALQKLLKVEQTGTFDAATKKAVKRVQRAAGLKANGVVTKRTLKAVTRAEKQASASRSLPRAGAPAASRRYARAYIAQKYGWGDGQMSCLSVLWTRESGWRYWVSNPNGIYRGIPQTSSRVWGPLGYSTAQYMRSPEIQIKVGAHYIKNRYGTPCNAWAFWRSHHWY